LRKRSRKDPYKSVPGADKRPKCNWLPGKKNTTQKHLVEREKSKKEIYLGKGKPGWPPVIPEPRWFGKLETRRLGTREKTKIGESKG